MRVLLVGFDLYHTVGGGQTFYRGVIETNPDVEFYYLREREPEWAKRPANAHALPYTPAYGPASLAGFAEPDVPVWLTHDFVQTANVARSVAGMKFDVVDTPDYDRHGHAVRAAFERHGARADKVVIGMHGTISTTVALNWGGTGVPMCHLVELEKLQYDAADARYFISPAYRTEWAGYSPQPGHYLDPMWAFAPPARRPYRPLPGPPTLLFVGRLEKRKGPHLFVQMAWWLPPDCYRDVVAVGPPVTDDHGKSSTVMLREQAAARDIGYRLRVEPAKTPTELADLYATNTVTVTPSVYDSLNLTALESLFAGCPTVVGSGAGVCRYLRERFPQVPFVELDLTAFYAQMPKVEGVLREYDRHRDALADALSRADLSPSTPPLAEVYRAAPAFDPATRTNADRWCAALSEHLQPL